MEEEKQEKNNLEMKCYDCDCRIRIKDDEVLGGKMLVYDIGDKEKVSVVKCDKCYEKNPTLTNYKRCEVYSRIVGYIRPVQQWNTGKQLEFKERVNYKTEE